MDDKKCIEFLNLGIAEKRNGNYEYALAFYEKAKEYNTQNSNVYYNSAKLLCGLAKYEAAIRNFLTYAHYSVLNDAFFRNPINLISIKDTLARIEKSIFNLPPNFSISPDWIKKIINDKRLSILLADNNLTFYTGFSFLASNKIYLKFYSIEDSHIQDIQNGLLGKKSNLYLKNPKYEIIIISFGLILLLENLKLYSLDINTISTFYLDRNFSIKSPVSENPLPLADFLDRNPEDKELDNFMTQTQKKIKRDLSLHSVYLGYNLLTDKIFDDLGMAVMGAANIGHTATIGFDKEILKDTIMQNFPLYLCYIALPIDSNDYLIEKEDMLDWRFEDYLTSKLQTEIVTVGALSKNEHKRCRTFKFIYQKNANLSKT